MHPGLAWLDQINTLADPTRYMDPGVVWLVAFVFAFPQSESNPFSHKVSSVEQATPEVETQIVVPIEDTDGNDGQRVEKTRKRKRSKHPRRIKRRDSLASEMSDVSLDSEGWPKAISSKRRHQEHSPDTSLAKLFLSPVKGRNSGVSTEDSAVSKRKNATVSKQNDSAVSTHTDSAVSTHTDSAVSTISGNCRKQLEQLAKARAQQLSEIKKRPAGNAGIV